MRDEDHVHKPFGRPRVEFDELVEGVSRTVIFRRDGVMAELVNKGIRFIGKPLAFAINVDSKSTCRIHCPSAEIPYIVQPLIRAREFRRGAGAAENDLALDRIRFQLEGKPLDFNGAKGRYFPDALGHFYDVFASMLFLGGDVQSRPFAGFQCQREFAIVDAAAGFTIDAAVFGEFLADTNDKAFRFRAFWRADLEPAISRAGEVDEPTTVVQMLQLRGCFRLGVRRCGCGERGNRYQ